MSKLNQIIAVSSTKKSQAKSALEKVYHLFQKTDLFNGIERVYQPKDDDGEQLPPESTKVQFRVDDLLESANNAWTEMFDVVMTQDKGNMTAKANVVVDGTLILTAVPVTTLIFLEKQLTDFSNLIGKIPTISEADNWKYNNEHELYESDEVKTHRTKKVQRPIVLYDATEHHPAQTNLVTEDVLAGYWKTKKLSSALSSNKKNDMLERVLKLKEAVIKAREQANSSEVEQEKQGDKVVNYLFGAL